VRAAKPDASVYQWIHVAKSNPGTWSFTPQRAGPIIARTRVDFADFQPALFAATVMNAFERPWCVAGGWAIDLWLGRLTRAHAGVGVAIFRDDQIALRDFLASGWRVSVVGPGGGRRAISPGDRQMLMVPVQRLLATPRGDSSAGREIEFLLNESDTVDWIYPRDARIRWPKVQWSVRGAFGVPALAPHLAMLFKSRDPRPPDELDLRSSVPALPPELKRWIACAIALSDASHPWIARLNE
jgi:hypothetical protein